MAKPDIDRNPTLVLGILNLMDHTEGESPNTALSDLLHVFLEAVPSRVQAMQEALCFSDLPSVAILAQELKSGCIHLGAIEAARICCAIERACYQCQTEDVEQLLQGLDHEVGKTARDVKTLIERLGKAGNC